MSEDEELAEERLEATVRSPGAERVLIAQALQQRDLLLPKRVRWRALTQVEESIERPYEFRKALLDCVEQIAPRPDECEEVHEFVRRQLERRRRKRDDPIELK